MKLDISIKQVITTILLLASFIGATFAFESYFVSAKDFETTMVGYQKDRARENAQRDVIYWIQVESNLRVQLAYAQPGSETHRILMQQLQSAIQQKIAAQDRLSKL